MKKLSDNLRDELMMAWKLGHDKTFNDNIEKILKVSDLPLSESVRVAQALLDTKRFFTAKGYIRNLCDRFYNEWLPPELMVDACFQTNDPVGALWGYETARDRGSPMLRPAVIRLANVCISTGFVFEAKQLLSDPTTNSFQAEALRLIDAEAILFSHHEKQYLHRLVSGSPTLEEIKSAALADPIYADYLFVRAFKCPTTSLSELARICLGYHPRPVRAHQTLGFTAWRLAERFPNEPFAQLQLAINGLMLYGDYFGAAEQLRRILAHSELISYPGAADQIVRLATTCVLYGSMEESEGLYASSRYLEALESREVLLLSSGFCVNSRPRKQVPDCRMYDKSVNDLKVACCVSGQLRNVRESWPTIQKAIAPFHAAVFVSTWNKVGVGFGTGNHTVTRRLPQSIRDGLALNLQSVSLFQQRYPKTYTLLAMDQGVTSSECALLFSTDRENIRVHDETAFEEALFQTGENPLARNLNQSKMYFGIHDAINIKNEYELRSGINFDVVIRIRPDLNVHEISTSDVQLCASSGVAVSSHLRITAVGDVCFMVPTKVADIIGGMWPKMLMARSFAIVPGATGAAAETALFENLCWNGVRTRGFRGTRLGGLSSNIVPAADLYEALIADISDLGTVDDIDRAVLTAFTLGAGR